MTDPTVSIAGTDKIVISHATKVIRRRTVLDDVSLELPRGGIYGFSGINGSGKTMLFRAIAGLIHLTSGTIDVFGRRIGRDAASRPGSASSWRASASGRSTPASTTCACSRASAAPSASGKSAPRSSAWA